MTKGVRATTAAALLAALCAGRAAAGSLDWSDRGDRREGLVRERPVDGIQFELVGLQVRHRLPAKAASLHLRVSQETPTSEPLEVEVREPRVGYLMVPAATRFVPGQFFSWPVSDVLGPAKVDLSKLRASVRQERSGLQIPADLTESPVADALSGYRFSFWTTGEVDLTWSVHAADGQQLGAGTASGTNGLVDIDWDVDPAVKSGRYRLEIKGTGYAAGSYRIDRVIEFQHDAATTAGH